MNNRRKNEEKAKSKMASKPNTAPNPTILGGPAIPTPKNATGGSNTSSSAANARNTVSGTKVPGILSTNRINPTSTKVFELAKSMAAIIQMAIGMVIRVDGGTGMSPEARRKLILTKIGVTEQDFAFFGAVHTRRGSNWRLYTRQDNELKMKYISVATAFGISMNPGDKGVTSQVVACALGDLLIGCRDAIPLEINGEKYTGALPAIYQWVGSLATMYVKEEDGVTDGQQITALWLEKTRLYADWMAWYVQKTGAITNTESTVEHTEYDLHYRILSGAHYAWGGWTIETRRAWAAKNYNIEPKSPGNEGRYAPLANDFILSVLDHWFAPRSA